MRFVAQMTLWRLDLSHDEWVEIRTEKVFVTVGRRALIVRRDNEPPYQFSKLTGNLLNPPKHLTSLRCLSLDLDTMERYVPEVKEAPPAPVIKKRKIQKDFSNFL